MVSANTFGLENDLYLRTLLRQPVPRTPVWVMRQAGRYLPEYREVRAKAGDFMSLCKNANFACDVTLQPLERFELDAAILFSDILTIPDAMGLGLYFETGEGPMFERTVRSEADVNNLVMPDPNVALQYVMNAVSTIRQALSGRVPLIGFAGSPWTLACYMIQGGSGGKSGFPMAQKMLYDRPDLLTMLLDKLIVAVTDYLNAQIEAGAQALMLFDSWGGLLAHDKYLEFSLTPMQRIVAGLKKHDDLGNPVPVTLFTKGGARELDTFTSSGAQAMGLDWTVSLGEMKSRVGNQLALQGNLHPNVLLGSPDCIDQAVQNVLADYGQIEAGQGHVFNLGHGITPDVPPENMQVLIDAVKKHSPQYH